MVTVVKASVTNALRPRRRDEHAVEVLKIINFHALVASKGASLGYEHMLIVCIISTDPIV